MAARIRRHRTLFTVVALAVLVGSLVVATSAAVQAAESPRRGGVLLAAIGADAPSLDIHQESTFAALQPVAPLYSTLLQIDPYNYPNVIGDAASEWKISPDGLTYTFKIRPGIRFHDGSPLTAADVKATYDKIVSPPEGVRSIRKPYYEAIASIEIPDPSTVVFKAKYASASLLGNLASPWNVIYPKKYLDKDPNYFKTNVMGSGPFKFKSYTRGSTFEGERNPDYFVKDRPYLDGYKFYISTETSVRAAAIRSGRAYIEFRDLPNSEVEAIRKQLGDKVVVQSTPFVIQFGIAINNTVKPFTDIRVRKALTLGIDRYTAGKVLYQLTGLRDVGAHTRPGTEWAIPQAELEKFPGFWRDADKSRAEARRLLAEAGYPNGFKVVLKNRNIKLPYQDWAVYVIQEWRKIGIEAEHRPLETATWYADGRDQGNFELMVYPAGAFIDDPDQLLYQYTTGSPQNWGRFSNPGIDDLYSRQARTLDPAERRKLVIELQKIVLENAYHMPGLWWSRNVVHWAKVKNWVAPPSHFTNQKLQDVWLAED
ncbi:MAG TPA: ABC transporter substrate-binding protein [Methylomirabilota bacterium]|jgi:peptide/nickel transport system substrate-binding protein|nr:ABC transporter substrate-binding protein [Methylomirabilota bacterium]